MATSEEYARWIVDNADKKGTPEFETVAKAYMDLKGKPASSPPAAGLKPSEKFVRGVTDPIEGGAQLLTHALPRGVVDAGNKFNNWLADKTGLVAKIPEQGFDKLVADNEQAYQARRTAAGESGVDGWRMTGNIASPANWGIARLLPVGQGASLLGRAATGAAGGAASSALNPVTDGDFGKEKTKQIAVGTMFGAGAPVVASGLSRVISPNASTNPQLQLLRREGVRPTVGQTLGGAANTMEEKLQSVPIMGDMIAHQRMRAREQFNNAAINRASNKIGEVVDGSGQQAVKRAGDLISDSYNAAKANLGGFRVDQQAKSELASIKSLAISGLEGREKATFSKYFKDYIEGNQGFTAQKFKELDSKLTTDIGKFSGSSDAYQQKLGDALKEVQSILLENAKRANPVAAKAVNQADAAWANLVRVEGAAKAAKLTNGVFTPGQLLTAIQGADKSVRDRATSRGISLMQDLANAGQNVLGNKVPDSGTAGRLGWGLTGAAGYADPLWTGGLLGSGTVAYTSPVQNLLRAAVSSRPGFAQPVADYLRQTSPMLAPAAGQVGLGLLN